MITLESLRFAAKVLMRPPFDGDMPKLWVMTFSGSLCGSFVSSVRTYHLWQESL